MNIKNRKLTVARMLNVGLKRIWMDPEKIDSIKEAITKADLKSLINDGVIKIKQSRGISRARANKILRQKRKGRKKGKGSREGKRTARLPRKTKWINSVRLQRAFLRTLNDKKMLSIPDYHSLRNKIKGGFFRSKRHIKLFIQEHNLIKK